MTDRGRRPSEASKLFKKIDTDGNKQASVTEMYKWISSNDELWDDLSKQTRQHPKVCKKGATRAAMELATGLDGQEALDTELTREQFSEFHKNYIQNPDGTQEFFHRAVFEIFDKDNNGVLDEKELDPFLDILYRSNSIFKGNIKKLPSKDKLRKIFFEKLDKDGDRKFDYDEVKSVINGDDIGLLEKGSSRRDGGGRRDDRRREESRRDAGRSKSKDDDRRESRNGSQRGSDRGSRSESRRESDEDKEASKAFKKLDKDGSRSASVEEMYKFVGNNDALWDELAKQTEQPSKVCKKAAVRAAMELATGLDGKEALDAQLSKDQFLDFHKKYVQDPAGQQEFFYRAVFEIFDKDNSGYLDDKELDPFLDILYKDASMFKGDIQKLPPKDKLRKIFFTKLDQDGDKKFDFEEIKSVITGNALEALGNDLDKANRSENKAANKAFKKMDKDGSKSASVAEMFQFIAKNDALWDQLATQTEQPPKACKKAATRAAMELATGLDGQAALDAELDKDQFLEFHEKYVDDPAGQQEFFYRAVFEIFDKDNSGYLDDKELDPFLDILYKSGSMFQGNLQKLPPKDKLRKIFYEKLDKDGDRKFEYEEIRMVITGGVADELGGDIHKAVVQTVNEDYATKKAGSQMSFAEMKRMQEEEDRKRREAEEQKEREEAEEAAAKAKLEEEAAADELYAKMEAEKKAKKEAKAAEKARKEEDRARQKEEKEAIKKAREQVMQAQVSMTTAAVMGAPPPTATKKSSSFIDCALFEYVMGLFMPPKHQIDGPGGGQLVKKESSCIILWMQQGDFEGIFEFDELIQFILNPSTTLVHTYIRNKYSVWINVP